MNRKIVYTLLLGSFLAFATSCLNYDNLIPKEFDKILLLKESGEKELTLYNTGEDGSYKYVVMKGGNNPSATAQAEVRVLSDVELKLHSQTTGVENKLLPSSMYELKTSSFHFTSDQSYLQGEVALKTSLIDELMKSDNSNYVLPLQLTSASDSVNSEKRLVLLKMKTITPIVSYQVSKAQLDVTGESATYAMRMTLPFESLWDFDVNVAADPASTPAGYTLLASNLYEILNGGKIQFKKGSKVSEPLNIKVNNSSASLGSSFVIPIKVTSTSIARFQFPTNSFILGISYNKIPLTVDMLSTNAQETYEGPIANLIDNNPATYFHSAYSYATSAPHYFQVKLKSAISSVQFFYQNRNNGNGKPQDVKILVSSDGATWKELTRIDSGLPTAPASTYNSPILKADQPFTYFRFEVQRTNSGTAPTFFNMAEFNLYGK